MVLIFNLGVNFPLNIQYCLILLIKNVMDGLSISGVKLLTLLFKSLKKKIPAYSMKNWQLLSLSYLNVIKAIFILISH